MKPIFENMTFGSCWVQKVVQTYNFSWFISMKDLICVALLFCSRFRQSCNHGNENEMGRIPKIHSLHKELCFTISLLNSYGKLWTLILYLHGTLYMYAFYLFICFFNEVKKSNYHLLQFYLSKWYQLIEFIDYWCSTSHATIFQLYMWRHRCAGGLKKKL